MVYSSQYLELLLYTLAVLISTHFLFAQHLDGHASLRVDMHCTPDLAEVACAYTLEHLVAGRLPLDGRSLVQASQPR